MKRNFFPILALGFAAATLVLCAASVSAQSSLKEAYKGQFLIGVAMNEAQFTEKDTVGAGRIKSDFNTITPENVMKWQEIHPEENRYDFTAADRYVEFGNKNGMFVIGHTFVWHYFTPSWLFKDAKGGKVNRETLLARLRDHIHTVVGRYKGRVNGWDVANEALEEDGSLRKSPWLEIIGDDYLVKAYEFAHEADPNAELYYNDYFLENPIKRKGAIALLSKLKAAGIPIVGVGIQEHVTLTWPKLTDLDDAISDFGKLGLKVMITELDVDVLPASKKPGDADINRKEKADPKLDPYTKGFPDDMQQKLAKRYADLFGVYLKHRGTVTRVTFWGLDDGQSWLNGWPIKGRTEHPLLFDRAGRPKPAYDAVLNAPKSLTGSAEPETKSPTQP